MTVKRETVSFPAPSATRQTAVCGSEVEQRFQLSEYKYIAGQTVRTDRTTSGCIDTDLIALVAQPSRGEHPIEQPPRAQMVLRHAQDEQWVILGLNDVTLFTGTLSECENWLDQAERLNRRHNPRSSLSSRIFAALRRMFISRGQTPPRGD